MDQKLLLILTHLLFDLANAREMTDVNIAAGTAAEELAEIHRRQTGLIGDA